MSCRSGMGEEWASQGLFLTPEGRDCPLWTGRSPHQGHAERAHCREGAHLPWVTRGCPPRSSGAQWLQRVASASLPGIKVGPGHLSQACEGP